jgi:pilus assembly protein CpaF
MSSPTAQFGPLQPFVDDPACQEIRVSRRDRVFVRRAGHLTPAPEVVFPSDVELRRFVEQLTGRSTATLRNLVHPLPGEMLVVALFPPASPNVTLGLFKPGTRPERWDDLIATHALPAEAAEYLTAAVREGTNVLIVGPPESGKATLLNVLVGTLPASEKIAVIDEARRLTTVRGSARVTTASGPERTRPDKDLVAQALHRSPKWVVLASALLHDTETLLAAVGDGHVNALATVPVSYEYHS